MIAQWDIDEIEEFIMRRFGSSDAEWLNGNCYWFAVILTNRFPHLKIYYEYVTGHFVAGLDGIYFDATGRMIPYKEPILFEQLKKDDILWYNNIVRDCIK